MKTRFNLKVLLSIIVFSQILTGCITYQCGNLLSIENLPDQSYYQNKPSIAFDVSFYTFLKGAQKEPVLNPAATDELIKSIEKVTRESNLFSKYTFDMDDQSDYDYTIQIELLNYGNYWAAYCSGFLSGLTLCVIPAYAKDSYRLTCKVFDKNGAEVKSYEYEECIKTWIQLLLFPFIGTTKKVPVEMRENMLKNFYNDLIRDGVLEYSYIDELNRKFIFFPS
jgi:hypothetical protein